MSACPRSILGSLGAVLIFSSRAAGAQETPPPAPLAPALAPPQAEAPKDPAAQEREERLDAIDQRSRIALRQIELAKEASDAAEKARPVVSAGPSGFSIASADKAYSIQLHGLLQADARVFFDDDAHKLTDRLALRRLRPMIDATFAKDFAFRFNPDFVEGRFTLFDAYLDYRPAKWLQFRVGKFKVPLGLERIQSASALRFVERAFPTDLGPIRDLGAQVSGEIAEGSLGYALGVFNGLPDRTNGDVDVDDSKEVAARVFTRPFATIDAPLLKGLLLGVSATHGEKTGTPTNTYLPTYVSPGQNAFFSYIADTSATPPPGSTVVAAGVHDRFNAQLLYTAGPLFVLGEYAFSAQKVAKNGSSDRLGHQAWQAAVAVVVTGEDLTFDGVKPRKNFDPAEGGWGALEIAARVHELRFDPSTFPTYAQDAKTAHDATAWTVGVNWYLNPVVKIVGNYEQTAFKGGAPAGRRDMERALLVRTQVAF